ncbi:MAG: baseplate J/gp47 family protein [Thermomicrobiales bacterium]
MIVDVRPGMSLAQVIVQLREAHGDSVTIRISPDASLLLTANEFRALALAAEREHVAIAVETADGLRRQLASLFGVPLAIPVEEDIPASIPDEDAESPDRPESEQPIDIASLRDQILAGTTTTTLQPAGGGAISSTSRGKGVPLSRLLLGAAVLGLLAAFALAVYWFLFREATVTLALQTEPVSSTIAFTVARPEVDLASAPGAIPSESVSFDLSMTLSAEATGTETIGGTAATGTLTLRNPGSGVIIIPAGTTIETFEGALYVFPEEVTVPGSAESGVAGETTADIAAATPGAGGNIDIGMLSGQLENGVYFSNRASPVTGGSDQVRTIVTQQDLDTLEARTEDALRALAATSELSGNRRVIPSTLVTRSFTREFSVGAGEEADAVTIDASISFDALAFSTEALDPAAIQSLESQVPSAYELLPETLAYQVPVETGNANGTISMLAQIDGEARVEIPQEELDALLDSLTGKTPADAITLLESNPLITQATISFSPDWLPHRLPSDAGRIDVVIE